MPLASAAPRPVALLSAVAQVMRVTGWACTGCANALRARRSGARTRANTAEAGGTYWTADGGWAVRTYVKPFANWIWAGAIVMALGGLLSLTDRRYRVAPGAVRETAPPVAMPAE